MFDCQIISKILIIGIFLFQILFKFCTNVWYSIIYLYFPRFLDNDKMPRANIQFQNCYLIFYSKKPFLISVSLTKIVPFKLFIIFKCFRRMIDDAVFWINGTGDVWHNRQLYILRLLELFLSAKRIFSTMCTLKLAIFFFKHTQ